MNIMHTVFSFNSGGIENLLVDTINMWDKKEDEIFLCIINDDVNQNLLDKIIINDKVKIIRLNRIIGGEKWGIISQFSKIVKEYKIDVIHCHSLSSVKISMISKIFNRKTKIVYTVHDMRIFTELSKIERKLIKLFVDKIIAISESVKKDIINIFPYEDRMQVVYNGVDFSKFKPIIKKREKLVRIGNVARIIPNKKGQDVLIRAIAIVKQKYPDILCSFAGETPKNHPEYLQELKKIVSDQGVEQNIEFIGNCDNVSKFLEEVDIFVLPSIYEGFGIAIIEALAAMRPVISTNLEGPKEILENYELGKTFSVENENELANLILNEINNPDIEKQTRIFKVAKDNFNITNSITEMKKVYKSLYL